MPKSGSVTIDPRRHDAVLFDAALPSSQALLVKLHDVRVGTGIFSADGNSLLEAAEQLSVRPGRCGVVASDPAAVTAARDAGFALVIGVARSREGLPGADAVVADLDEVRVRTGDRRMSELPDALQTLDLADDFTPRAPAVFYDFDGTLSDIVNDPDEARPAAGASEALQELAARCPVAILSGRDLADVRER